MRSAARHRGRLVTQAGLSLAELLVVLAIVAVVTGMSMPSLSRAIENTKLKTATQSLASLYQQARERAAQDDTSYEVLVSPAGANGSIACIDLDGDGKCGVNEPTSYFPQQVSFNNNGLPLAIGQNILGYAPLTVDNSQMFDLQNQLAPGLAWTSRGVPCERTLSATVPCLPIAGWVQYVQFQRAAGDIGYGAVSVSPAGRIRSWTYVVSGNGNGKWL